MNSLCDAVGSEIAKAFKDESTDWEVCPDGPSACVVRMPRLLITFTQDPRDKLVSSSLTFIEIEEKDRSELDIHIIAKLFPEITFHYDTKTPDVGQNIALEVDNVKNILEAIRKNNISPRDLDYFALGYSSAYEDYLNSN